MMIYGSVTVTSELYIEELDLFVADLTAALGERTDIPAVRVGGPDAAISVEWPNHP